MSDKIAIIPAFRWRDSDRTALVELLVLRADETLELSEHAARQIAMVSDLGDPYRGAELLDLQIFRAHAFTADQAAIAVCQWCRARDWLWDWLLTRAIDEIQREITRQQVNADLTKTAIKLSVTEVWGRDVVVLVDPNADVCPPPDAPDDRTAAELVADRAFAQAIAAYYRSSTSYSVLERLGATYVESDDSHGLPTEEPEYGVLAQFVDHLADTRTCNEGLILGIAGLEIVRDPGSVRRPPNDVARCQGLMTTEGGKIQCPARTQCLRYVAWVQHGSDDATTVFLGDVAEADPCPHRIPTDN